MKKKAWVSHVHVNGYLDRYLVEGFECCTII